MPIDMRGLTLIVVLLGTIMTISKDRVKPSPLPDSWKLQEIFATGIVLGSYLALMTIIFFWAMKATDFFPVRIIQLTYVQVFFLDQTSNIPLTVLAGKIWS